MGAMGGGKIKGQEEGKVGKHRKTCDSILIGLRALSPTQSLSDEEEGWMKFVVSFPNKTFSKIVST